MSSLPLSSHAYRGGETGGGGDPLANDFVNVGRTVQGWLLADKLSIPSGDSAQIKETLDSIDDSLDGKTPLIRFPDQETVSCYGVTKEGCVHDDGSIDIARKAWEKASLGDRFELVSLELFKIANVHDRYAKASLVRNFAERNSASRHEDSLSGPKNPDQYLKKLNQACNEDQRGWLVTYGNPDYIKVEPCREITEKTSTAFYDTALLRNDVNDEDYNLGRAAARLESFLKESHVKGAETIDVKKISATIHELDCSQIVPSNSQACASMILNLADKVVTEAEKICLKAAAQDRRFYSSTIEDQARTVKSCVNDTFFSNQDSFGLKN